MEQYVPFIQSAIGHIESNLFGSLSPACISAAAHVSQAQLYRLFPALTGLSVMEYVRLRRLADAAIEIRHTAHALLDISLSHGYESQEAFSRAFQAAFGMMPGEYRKSGVPLPLQGSRDILKSFLHKAAHESIGESDCDPGNVSIFTIDKPGRKWVAKVNRENWPSFYEECEKLGIMAEVNRIGNGIRYGGGLLRFDGQPGFLYSYGMEVPAEAETEVPDICEIFDIPPSTFVVFNHPPYPPEDHGFVIKSLEKAINAFDPAKHGLAWNPMILKRYEDDDWLGFTIQIPVIHLTPEPIN